MRDPLPFWSFFRSVLPSLETSLRDLPAGLISPSELRKRRPDLLETLGDYDRGLSLELSREAGGFRMAVCADGAVEDFDAARALVAAAPEMRGWRLDALRPRRALASRVVDGDLSMPTEGLRFSYGLANDRMVALILFEERPPVELAAGHYLARRLVADLLGEEDDALWIADARLVSYADWLAVTPGGRSWPIQELAPRFDAIFHPPVRRLAERAVEPRALSA